MISYLKMLLLSFFGGVFAALPVSYGAHYAFLADVTSFTKDASQLGFYFAVISVTFAVAVFFALRKVYVKAVAAPFRRSAKRGDLYRQLFLNAGITLLPGLVLLIPVNLPDGSTFIDVYPHLLDGNYLLLTAGGCVGSGLFLFIAAWYARQHYGTPVQASKTRSAIRYAIYQLPCWFLPGLAHGSVGATSLILTDLDETAVVREWLFCFAPPLFLVNAVRIVRYILSGVVLNPAMIAVAVAGALLGSALVLWLLSKVNLRKTFLFFALYSILFGAGVGVYTFL